MNTGTTLATYAAPFDGTVRPLAVWVADPDLERLGSPWRTYADP